MDDAPKKNHDTAFDEIYLKTFKKNNSHCKISVEDEEVVFDTPWGTTDNRLLFPISDIDTIQDLNNIALNPRFDAIIHLDTNLIEFLYGYIPTDLEHHDFINRSFSAIFNGKKNKCYYAKPTDRLFTLAKHFKMTPGALFGLPPVRQMIVFQDAQHLDTLKDSQKKFFKNRVPINFFIKPEEPILDIELDVLCRHINLLAHYYDRLTPVINIRDEDHQVEEKYIPKRYLQDTFPEALVAQPVDDILLRLLDVARETSPRFAYLYYYQVFEYAGFDFVDESVKKSLRMFLRDPAMINCAEDRISELFALFTPLSYGDETRMLKAFEANADPHILWKEIEHDKEFFTKKILFDGGFELQPLISHDTTESAWCTMWTPKLFYQFTKIRNCLVHARERRHSSVILPTKANNYRIKRYLPIITRAAELVAIYI